MSFGFPELAAIRLGFGLSALTAPAQNADALLAGIAASAPNEGAATTDIARQKTIELRDARRARDESGQPDHPLLEAVNRELSEWQQFALKRRLIRAIDDPTGFGERLVQFWSDHFTVIAQGAGAFPLAEAFVDEAIRPHLTGRFEDLFFAADTHPMMLSYLNQVESRGPNSPFAKRRPEQVVGLNENLAREAMELHSMGVGATYSQNDVRELAKLLTGLDYTLKDGFIFRPQMAEPGAETVLGKTYGGTRRDGLEAIRDAFRDIARRPDTARHLSHKLAVHFVSDTPSDALVAEMADVWLATGGELLPVYRVLVTHPDLAANLRQKVRQPFELMAASCRALGVSGASLEQADIRYMRRTFFGPMAAMGQPWGKPSGPDGWPEDGPAWIGPQMLAARINWSLRMPSLIVPELPDPRSLLQVAFGGTQSEQLAWAVPKAETQIEGVALVLASNDFNRR